MSFMDRAVGPSIKLSISAVSENAPRYVVRDRDRVYGARFIQRVRAMGSRSRHARHGKMDMRRGSSARSDVIASTMSLSSASRIFAICCARIKDITMRAELICPYARTRRSHAPSGPVAISSSRPFWVDCTINKGGFEFPTGTGCGRSSAAIGNQGLTQTAA
jgi:hypothetical protein